MSISNPETQDSFRRNIKIYPWLAFCRGLVFWQATWFLYFQNQTSAATALLIYAAYDIAATLAEVPSGYMSDRIGRRFTLIAAGAALLTGTLFLAFGTSGAALTLGFVLLGFGAAFNSGTDSALLFQSLAALGREDEMEGQSLRAWRATFSALALSAITGGALALWHLGAPFWASLPPALAFVLLALSLTEPPGAQSRTERARLKDLAQAFRKPEAAWIFALGLLLYGFSHVPFVFGQPFIQEVIQSIGLSGEAPLVSGGVTTTMMMLSLLASLIAPKLRHWIGLHALLLLALALQIGMAAGLAASASVLAIGLLLLRMVPDAFSTAFIAARLQVFLVDSTRATFLSLKSLAGRLLFAASLWAASLIAPNTGTLPITELQSILSWYAAIGATALAALALTAIRLPKSRDQSG